MSARKAHLCETRLVPAVEMRSWVRMARPGDCLVYCTGPTLPRGETSALARDLRDKGVVQLNVRRARGCAGSDYLMLKRAEAAARPAPVPLKPVNDPDPATEAIYTALARCAQRGRRAFSDRELAQIAGLSTRNQASWRVRRLVLEGRIATQIVPGPDGVAWRIVHVGGRRTAAP